MYRDTGRDSTLTSVNVDGFPMSVSCHWTSGYSTEAVWPWASPLLYVGLACAVGCSGLPLVNRHKDGKAPRGIELDT